MSGFSGWNSRRFLLFAALAVVGLGASLNPVSAGTYIWYNLNDGNGWIDFISDPGTDVSKSSKLGSSSITVNVSASSNIPGDVPTNYAELLSSSVRVENSSTGPITSFQLLFGADGYLVPLAPPNVIATSGTGGSVFTGSAANKLSFTTYIAPVITHGPPINDITTNAGTVIINTVDPNVTAVGAYKTDNSAYISSLAAGYSVAQIYQIQLGASGKLNFSGSTTLATPEPASMAIFGIGALGLAGYGFKRRNKKQVSA